MAIAAVVVVIVLIRLNSAALAVHTGPDFSQVKHQLKRQVGQDLCFIPQPLENGAYSAHERRCPRGDNSAACRLVPWTPVSTGWVVQYACDLGYRLNSTRVASICLPRQGGARWLPALPQCLESAYTSHFLPAKNVCGRPSKHLRTKRKVDGKLAKRGAWPWMVIFGHRKSNNPSDGYHWFCAGTLVTTHHVLTAANCVGQHRRRPVFLARLDDLHLDDSVSDGAEPIEVAIEKKNIITYPGFQPDVVFSHNIAVVKLKTDVRITDFVRPICLPTPDFKERSFTGETVYFTTWGQTDNDREKDPKKRRRFEPVLHEISAQVIDHGVCNYNYRQYQSSDTPIIVSDRLICAAVNVNKSCQGDIGSPLMMKYKGSYFLLGIVATDYRCFDDQFPRLFTNLALYMDWIVANLKF